jgi:methionyl-tRNA synthetase
VPDFIEPESKRNEVISFVKSGLKDLSISRTSFKWGVPVPNDEKHIMYVWLDALTNYISALNFAEENNKLYQDFWCNTQDSPIHIVGKDILRFHCVYWPAFLMAAKLPLPNRVFAHGWWTNCGQKISKSLGNVIDPYKEIEWLQSFKYQEAQGENTVEKNLFKETSVDYFRYFLLKEVPFGNDGDYSRDNLINRINSELANNIGNLVQRSLSMIVKNCNSLIPDSNAPSLRGDKIAVAIHKDINELSFNQALDKIIELSNTANKYFNDQAPWKLKKEGKIEEMNQVLFQTVESIRIIAILLLPFIPYSANKILDLLNVSGDERNFSALDKSIKSGQRIAQPQIIFPSLRKV